MRIKSLAQGENILMLGIEPSTFVSKIDILTTTPIVPIVPVFVLARIKRSFCALVNTCFALFYKAIVRLHIEYAATIWNQYKKDYIGELEKMQCRARKLLHSISHLSYPDCLSALNLPTLVYCNMRGDMIKTFKILNNIYDSRATNFLTKATFHQQEDIT